MPVAPLLAFLLQVTPAPEVAFEAVHPEVVRKLVRTQDYGVKVTTPDGVLLLTDFSYLPEPRGAASYAMTRMHGPGILGPYRYGLKVRIHGQTRANPWGDCLQIQEVADGSPARKANLRPGQIIRALDGRPVGRDLWTLLYRMSQCPRVELTCEWEGAWGGAKTRTFLVEGQKEGAEPSPGDVELAGDFPSSYHQWNEQKQNNLVARKEALLIRSKAPSGQPLKLPAGAPSAWVVWHRGGMRPALEFWDHPPQSLEGSPEEVWLLPAEGLKPGRIVRRKEQWLEVTALESEGPMGILRHLDLRPLDFDVQNLLAGRRFSSGLGTLQDSRPGEGLEQAANEALLYWKAKGLSGYLQGREATGLEGDVFHIEKGLLLLDLEVKGIRARLDAAARAEAERKAQAELAAKEGKPAPAAAPPAAESERLADLLDQRKAILMAVLGSAKQALANLRR
jgi:hypothetical protein